MSSTFVVLEVVREKEAASSKEVFVSVLLLKEREEPLGFLRRKRYYVDLGRGLKDRMRGRRKRELTQLLPNLFPPSSTSPASLPRLFIPHQHNVNGFFLLVSGFRYSKE